MPDNGKKNKPRELVAELRVFDRYYLKRTLGHGGMGTVWLAHDRVLEQPVALKFLADQLFHNHHEIERLKQEMRRNLKLSHPNIVRIHDFEQDGQGAAIAMEYVDGWSLWAMRVDKPRQIFDAAEIAPWICDLCGALEYAHKESQIVHRDLKPANLLINSRGQLKVTDFGLARELREAKQEGTAPPKVVGTDWYMGPQQWTGEPPAVADDIYSLGATIYELLTSKPPFYEGDILKQVFEDMPPSMTERLHQLGIEDVVVPFAWEETVAACLAKDAERRPRSAREVAVRLGLIDGPKPAPLPPPVEVTEPAGHISDHEPPPNVATAESAAAFTDREREVVPALIRSSPRFVSLLVVCVVFLGLSAWYAVQRVVKSKRAGGMAPVVLLVPGEVWQNSLNMRFVSVPGTPVMFSIWETRVQDFEAFARDTGYDAGTDVQRMNADGKWQPGEYSWRNPDFPQVTNSPVVGVTWRDAEQFCGWLTEHERKLGILKSNQSYRLPRTAEWIYAAGTTLYPWGDEWPPPAGAGNFAGEEIRESLPNHSVIAGYRDGYARSAPVGSFKPNALGIYDLAGNVWEFCADGPPDGPKARWMMGGSWDNATKDALAISNRSRNDNARRYSHRGFRVVLVWKKESGNAGPSQ